MKNEAIEDLLYKRYIEPTKRKRTEYIGVEIEMPILNLNKEAVDFGIVHKVTENTIKKFGLKPVGIDDEGNFFSAANIQTGDILSYDCSYNNLELSLGKEKEIFTVKKRFDDYYSYLKEEFNKYNYTLTGMGINPYKKYNNNVPIPSGRYRMLFHHLHSYKSYNLPMYFHSYPEYGTFSSASQVQLDVEYDKLPLAINTFSKLEPVKAILFSNSVLLGECEDILCARDMFWENSTHGINPHNIGMFDCEFSSADEILSYIKSTSIYCVEKDNKYINFQPVNIADYFNRDKTEGEYFENGSYHKIIFEPEEKDIKYLRTFKFEDLTFRGTIEFRSVCTQPIADSMSAAAFHTGLMDRLTDLAEILNNDRVLYHRGYTPSELRRLLIRNSLPSFIDESELYKLAENILNLARDSLKERGYGEEVFLKPLYDRVKNKTNPAKTILTRLQSGIPLERIISDYSSI
ncbi:MAG: glutamylcysteine synthetase [Clostridiales bacterium]|nr:glutamylcysteine synthetase [Clostridiales bacterium]